METVIAIAVLAVLLTAFIAVFAPAAKGIRKSISMQEADRLTHTLKEELTTLRGAEAQTFSTGFDKAFNWIEGAGPGAGSDPLFIYQYRGDVDANPRTDGTLEPYTASSGVAGQDYTVQSVVRRRSDAAIWEEDLEALEGGVYAVVLTQLVFDNGTLVRGDAGKVNDPNGVVDVTSAEDYPEAVIALAADFFVLKSTSITYIQNQFDVENLETPVFSRNIAIRR